MEQEQNTKRILRLVRARFWKYSWYWGFVLILGWASYFYHWQGFYTFGSFAETIAAAASILIAASFALGTFCFYFDILDHELGYRKYLGLLGYYYLLVYSVMLLLAKPDEFLFPPLAGRFTLEQLLGLGALLVLTFMALVGHDERLQRANSHLWRNSLRAGYLVYLFLIPRAVLLDGDLWIAWARGAESILPPPSLVMTVIALATILFRLSVFPVVWFRQFLPKRPANPPAQSTD